MKILMFKFSLNFYRVGWSGKSIKTYKLKIFILVNCSWTGEKLEK